MDLADAPGLSIVHVSRTFRELRRLNILSKKGSTIKVVDRERLAPKRVREQPVTVRR
ncbi:hypothetical protein RSO01_93790 [Reyranella soli]|uniref:HTH crp-type domain-containing protein n=2 Tax=Reyranella soli TaxID=1230389 RepID=A0A512NTB9_9HYPH|nr:hypothetical protein RSO01_93790 [Reyranella soli]